MENKIFDAIILGAGASGCFALLHAKSKNVAIVDKFPSLGKKILATGNGRCNLTNQNMSSTFFNTNIDNFLARFSTQDTIETFKSLGLEVYSDEQGRVYPLSNSAKSVEAVLENALKSKGKFFGEEEVLSVKKQGDKFEVETEKQTLFAKKVVVCLGGNSGIAKSFGLKQTQNAPSLASLKIKCRKSLENIRLHDVCISASDKVNTYCERGEVMFRENALSGICVFNVSSLFARNKTSKGEIVIDLLPDFSEQEVENMLENRCKFPLPARKFFDGLFLPQVGLEILIRNGIDENSTCGTITPKDLKNFAKTIKNLSYEVFGVCENNQVFSGGVGLENLDENLQSKDVENLYFAGEACDVDGICGGYNLQWAWTSGKIVGESL